MTIFFLVRWVVLKAGTEKPRAETDPLQKFTEAEDEAQRERGMASIVERKKEGEEEAADKGFGLKQEEQYYYSAAGVDG